jgi:hypothetical protein
MGTVNDDMGMYLQHNMDIQELKARIIPPKAWACTGNPVLTMVMMRRSSIQTGIDTRMGRLQFQDELLCHRRRCS